MGTDRLEEIRRKLPRWSVMWWRWPSEWHVGSGLFTPTSPVVKWWCFGPLEVRRRLSWKESKELMERNRKASLSAHR